MIFLVLILSICGFFLQTLPSVPSVPPMPTSISPDAGSSTLYLAEHGVLGDGETEESSKVNTLLTYAKNNGYTTVVFPANKVIITDARINVPSGLILIGNGCTLKLKNNAGNDQDPIMALGINATCSGMKFDGNYQNIRPIPGGPGAVRYGIGLKNGSIFDGNEVFNIDTYSVNNYAGSNIQITNNIIHDGRQYGINTGGSDGPSSWGYNITVIGNTIYNMQQVGIKIRGTKGAVIARNTIRIPSPPGPGQGSRGISLYSFDEPNDNIQITDNTVTGVPWGAYWSGCIDSDDQYNTNIRITNNRVSDCSTGIAINFNNGIITGNTVSNCEKGIDDNGTDNIINNNIINNKILID